MIRPATTADAKDIVEIYNHYIKNTVITFEEECITDSEMACRINKVTDANLPWLVITHDDEILGYAYATPWKERSAYRNSVETTVYLAPSSHRKGLGSQIYQALLTELTDHKIHTAIGGITLPNPASIALHEKLGMAKVAHFEQVGRKFDQWLDVGYWQLVLND